MAFRTISVCAGVGGLDLGVRIARPDARCVALVEREASAAASLVASMEAGRLHPAAVWPDLRTFDAGAWRGAVDCVLSGDPCQGNSVAGKRLGAADDRWLLDRAIEVFDESGAAVFFRENVVGNLAGQIAAAVPALERLGCRVACGIFSAAEAGASHRRERFFLLAIRSPVSGWDRLANASGDRCEPGRSAPSANDDRCSKAWRAEGHQPSPRDCSLANAERDDGGSWTDVACLPGRARSDGDARRSGDALDDAECPKRGADSIPCDCQGADAHARGRDEGPAWVGASSQDLADPNVAGSSIRSCAENGRGIVGQEGPPARARRYNLPTFAPGPADSRWPSIIAAAPSLEPAVCRVADGVAGRIERLRHCGNGVVPLAAALAWVRLHGLLADAAAGDAVRFADDRSASAGAAVVSTAA